MVFINAAWGLRACGIHCNGVNFIDQGQKWHAAGTVVLRHALVQALRLIASDEQVQRVLLIATHKVEYTEELCAVQQRHLNSQKAVLQHIHTALATAFSMQNKAPPVPLETAAGGLQMLVEGMLHQWLLTPKAFALVQTGVNALDVYLAGLGLSPLEDQPL